MTIKLKNRGRRPSSSACWTCPTPSASSRCSARPSPCQRLEPGEETAAHDGESIPVQVPNEYWALGIGEITDIIKAIVSTTDLTSVG